MDIKNLRYSTRCLYNNMPAGRSLHGRNKPVQVFVLNNFALDRKIKETCMGLFKFCPAGANSSYHYFDTVTGSVLFLWFLPGNTILYSRRK
jgi:hypothetical protein